MGEFPNITPEDVSRWPEETSVLVDVALARGDVHVYAPDDCDAALHLKRQDVRPYDMRDRDGHLSMFAADSRRAWSGNSPPPMIGLAESIRQWEHRDCPLLGCEDFDGQRLFPVALTVRPQWLEARGPNMFDVVRDAHDMIGEPISADSTRRAEMYFEELRHRGSPQTALQVAAHLLAWMEDPRTDQFREASARERHGYETARGLAAVINSPPRWPVRVVSREELRREYETPRTLHFSNGSSIKLPSVADVHPADTVTINGVTFRAVDLIRDPSPAYDAMEPTRCVPITSEVARETSKSMTAASRARANLRRARPVRRLDGRRTR